MKKCILATLSIFIAWQFLDYVFHGVILMDEYSATANLWRPMEEMNRTLMMIVSLLTAGVFTKIYETFVSNKNIETGVKFGLYYGLATGIGMSLGSYSYMPITTKIAIIWFVAAIVSSTVAGAIVGKFITDD